MKPLSSTKALVGLILLALSATLSGQGTSPKLATVTPETGKAAAEYSTAGENLSKSEVKDLYLTDGKNDVKLEILSQAGDLIKFRVPDKTPAGRYGLMILTADGKRFIEQPVKLTIEE